MSAFAIFVCMLTFGYVIYYIVMIMQDLHKKGDTNPNKDIEEIDVSQMQETEEPTVVSENVQGFQTGQQYEDNQEGDSGITYINNEDDIIKYQEKIKEKNLSSAAEECTRIQQAMEPVDVECSGGIEADVMLDSLVNQKPGGPRIFQTKSIL